MYDFRRFKIRFNDLKENVNKSVIGMKKSLEALNFKMVSIFILYYINVLRYHITELAESTSVKFSQRVIWK